MKDRDGNEWRMVPVKATDEMIAEMLAAKDFDSIWPAAIAAAPQLVAGEVTDDVAARVLTHFSNFPVRLSNAQNGRDMIAAVRSELGPALGLVEIREPTPEECAAIHKEWMRAHGIEGYGAVCNGRAMFDACRAVLWPKEGL